MTKRERDKEPRDDKKTLLGDNTAEDTKLYNESPEESSQKSSPQLLFDVLEMKDDYIEFPLVIKKLGT